LEASARRTLKPARNAPNRVSTDSWVLQCAIPFNRRRMEGEDATQVRYAFTKRSHPALFELRVAGPLKLSNSQKAGLRLLSNNRSFSPAFWPETTAGGTYPGRTGSSPHLCFVRRLRDQDAIPGRHGCTPACTLTLSVLRSVQPVPVGPILLKRHLFIPLSGNILYI